MNTKTTMHDDLASNCNSNYYCGQSVAHPADKAKTQSGFCYYFSVWKFWQLIYGLLQITAATLSADLLNLF